MSEECIYAKYLTVQNPSEVSSYLEFKTTLADLLTDSFHHVRRQMTWLTGLKH